MFYGWYIVGSGILLSGYNGIVSIYGFTAFIEPIAQTFGWSYAAISLATSLRGMESGALTPLMGSLVDRYPARKLALWGVSVLIIGYFCFSQATNLFLFYISFLIMGLGGSLGAYMVPQTSLTRWFRKDLGKASGVLFLGNGFSGLFAPVLVFFIDRFGWQQCLVYYAIGFLILGIPAALVFRTRPEEYGLFPDGKPQGVTLSQAESAIESHEKSVKQALKMRAFWLMGIATAFQVIAWSAFSTHLMPYFSSLGIERSIGGRTIMAVALISLVARFPFGWVCDIFDMRYMMALSIGLNSIALFFFWLLRSGSFPLLTLFIIFAGIATAGMMPVRIPIYREYFGVKNFGKIYGLGNLFFTFGIITGAPIAGWVYDTFGYYDPIWWILSILTAIGAVLILIMPAAGSGDRGNDSK
ncbi:MAG: MFS transporter [Deltaproteobacteria bacterium]|nr:MFS transporter [Deltaproteobacteria bacterium]